jgi:hypothetical protein
MNCLGVMYREGQGVSRDQPVAQNDLGVAYLEVAGSKETMARLSPGFERRLRRGMARRNMILAHLRDRTWRFKE